MGNSLRIAPGRQDGTRDLVVSTFPKLQIQANGPVHMRKLWEQWDSILDVCEQLSIAVYHICRAAL